MRAISTLPGVAQVSNGRNDLLVRGGAPSENLYLIDGLEVPNINHFGTQGAGGGPLSFVNLDFVRETTFSTGGFPVRHGDRISSVLEIDLRDGRQDKLGGKATISASQFGLNLEGPVTDQGSFLFSARRSYLDLIFRASGFSFVPEYWDVLGKATARLGSSDQVSGFAIVAIDRVRFFNDDREDVLDNSRILDNSQDQLVAGITWKHLFESGFLKTTLGRTRVDYRFGQSDTNQRQIFSNNSIEDELSLRTDASLQIEDGPGGAELEVGGAIRTTSFNADMELSQTEPGLALNLDEQFEKASAYAQLSRRFLERLDLTFGGRADWFGAINDSFYPALRLSASLSLTDVLAFNVSGGRYTQAPSYIWLAANDSNSALRATVADVVVAGFDRLLSDDLKVTLESYYKNYRDYPASAERPYLVLANTGTGFGGADNGFASFGLERLVSEGSGRAFGAELFLQKKLSNTPWYGVASLSVNKSLFTGLDAVERPFQFDQRVIFNLSGGWRISDTWEAGIKFRFATGRPYTPIDSTGDPSFGYQVVEEYHSRRLDPSHQLDIRVDKRWPLNGWNLITYVDIQNVYNRKNPSVPRWDPESRTGEVNDPIGILPSIGVSAEW